MGKTKVHGSGGRVFIPQNKTTFKTRLDPAPYTVTLVNGNRMHAQRHDGSAKV